MPAHSIDRVKDPWNRRPLYEMDGFYTILQRVGNNLEISMTKSALIATLGSINLFKTKQRTLT